MQLKVKNARNPGFHCELSVKSQLLVGTALCFSESLRVAAGRPAGPFEDVFPVRSSCDLRHCSRHTRIVIRIALS